MNLKRKLLGAARTGVGRAAVRVACVLALAFSLPVAAQDDDVTPAAPSRASRVSRAGSRLVLSEPLRWRAGEAKLTDESRQLVRDVIDYLREQPGLTLSWHVHTFQASSAKENLALSKARAGALLSYFTDAGGYSRLGRYEGHGAERPIAELTRANLAVNDRVEFFVEPAAEVQAPQRASSGAATEARTLRELAERVTAGSALAPRMLGEDETGIGSCDRGAYVELPFPSAWPRPLHDARARVLSEETAGRLRPAIGAALEVVSMVDALRSHLAAADLGKADAASDWAYGKVAWLYNRAAAFRSEGRAVLARASQLDPRRKATLETLLKEHDAMDCRAQTASERAFQACVYFITVKKTHRWDEAKGACVRK